MPIGAKVTLRGDRMWEFLDRLLTVALPRIRDFRRLSDQQFDGNGNHTFGLSEQTMFYEIYIDKIDRTRGMDITLVTTATNDDDGRALLRHLGFPVADKDGKMQRASALLLLIENERLRPRSARMILATRRRWPPISGLFSGK